MKDWLYEHPEVSRPLATILLVAALAVFIVAEFVDAVDSTWALSSVGLFLAGMWVISDT